VAGPVWTIVVAAGQGTRFGGQKQFALVGGHSVVELALRPAAVGVAGVVVVLPDDLARRADPLVALGIGVEATASCELRVAAGRETRAGSVRAGLEMVPPDCEIVVVHDAARPLASERLFDEVVSAVVAGADGAIPGVPLSDTVKRVSEGTVRETLDRSGLVRVQTPQAFRAATLRRAHAESPEATDDAALVEALGGKIVVVAGDESNLKVTSPADLDLVEWWYERMAAR